MAIAVVGSVNVVCEHCGEMLEVDAADYIANLDDVVPSFLAGLSYECICDECQTMNIFTLPEKTNPMAMLSKIKFEKIR